MIPRTLGQLIQKKLFGGKAIIILGARQVGKTTMIKNLFGESSDMLWLNGDEPDIQNLFKDNVIYPFQSYFWE